MKSSGTPNQLRLVVELWNAPGKPLADELSEQARTARGKLRAVFGQLGKQAAVPQVAKNAS